MLVTKRLHFRRQIEISIIPWRLLFKDKKGDKKWLKLNQKISSQGIEEEYEGETKLFYLFLRAKYFPEDSVTELIQEKGLKIWQFLVFFVT